MSEPDPPAAADPRRRRTTIVAWAVVGVVMVGLASVAVVRLFVADPADPGRADSVRAVADASVEVADTLDVQGGLDLLCEEPIDLYRMAVESTIVRWQTLSGTQTPSVTARASEVAAGTSGSFLLRVSVDEKGLDDERRTFRVFVEKRGSRSCVVGIGGRKAERPSVRFAGEGYSGVTSPTPTPRTSGQ